MLLNTLSSASLYLVLTLFALLILSNNYYYYYHAIVVDKKKYKYVEDLIIATEYGLSFAIFIILVVSLFMGKERISLSKCKL